MATATIDCIDEAWEWDKDNKSSAIEVTDINLAASRPSSAGKNPAVLGVKPLSKSSPHFRIEIETIGSWIGIGIADLNFVLDGGSVIGSQSGCINSCYFHQGSSSLKFGGEKTKKTEVATPIIAGNLLDVYIDFDAQRILFWNNNAFLGALEAPDKNLEEGKLYACANLSANTKVRFRNQDKPSLQLPEEFKPKIQVQQAPATLLWKWNVEKKAEAVVLSENDTAASRPTSEGNNPAVLGTQALSKQNNHFRVKINSAGKWIGIGFADENYKLNGGSTLGNQKECLNCSYFHQSNTTLNISNAATQHRFNVDVPLAADDVIDILVDFENHKVHFWNNNKYIGVINHASVSLEEHKIYPCVNLSATTTITLDQNPPLPEIPKEPEPAPAQRSIATSSQPTSRSIATSTQPQRSIATSVQPSSTSITEPVASQNNSNNPLKQSAVQQPFAVAQPTGKPKYQALIENWKWSSEKKSTAITLTDNDLSAARPSSEGSNPAVIATAPLTKANPHFRVRVKKMGNWIGIGVVDDKFTLNGGSIIGGQNDGFNSGYFFQSKASLSLSGQSKVTIDKNIETDNVIDVYVNFDEQKIHYWNTGFYVGCMELSPSNTIVQTMKEGELYPCANLAATTEVVLLNDEQPLLKFDNEADVEEPVIEIPTSWVWSVDDKPAAIELADNDTSASRPTVSGKNPAVRAKHPLTRARPHFQVHVAAMGKWIGVGIVEKEYQWDGGAIIGKQTGCFNAGYFKQSAAHLQMNAKNNDKVDIQIAAGDIIDIKINFDEKKVMFWNNQRYLGSFTDPAIEEGKLYPCVNLAASTTVTFTNEPEPIGLPTEKAPESGPSLTKSVSNNNSAKVTTGPVWVWGTKKADAITVDNSDFTACRPDSSGSNPAVLASEPLTKDRNWFRLRVDARGGWIGLGIADASFILNGGDTLGCQAGVNCAYFDQNAAVLQMTNETSVELTKPIEVNDLIDIKVDFDAQKILFWKNDEYVGAMAPTKNTLTPGEIYPCANMSATTKVTFRNEDSPKFTMPESRVEEVKDTKKAKKERKEKGKSKLNVTASTSSSPVTPSATGTPEIELKPVKLIPYSWRWTTDADKKPEAILLEDKAVSRPTSDGRNPAITTTETLNSQHPHFRIRILTLGNWIGIGAVDKTFKNSGGSVIGAQTEGINGGFFQQSKAKMQLYGEDSVEIPEKVEANDVIDVYINFKRSKMHVWRNEVLFATLECKSVRLREDCLYPVVQLSANTKVVIEDTAPNFNLTLPAEKVVNKVEELTTMPNFDWTWDDKHKAEAITLADDGHIAARKTAQGSNPAVRTTESLTEERFHFRVRIKELGSWIGIGVCDEFYQMNEGAPIGRQVGGLNCAYASQAEGKIRMHGEKEIDAVKLKKGDVIDVAIDFTHDKIFFWRNEQPPVVLDCQHTDIKEGQVWPCVALSTGSEVEFLNEEPSLYMPLSKSKKQREQQTTSTVAYNYTWKWSDDKKSSALELAPDSVTVHRPSSSGMNPAVLGSTPMNAAQSCFRVNVVSMGNWIGIGIAEKTYQTDGGSILGRQDNVGVNCGYFFQNSSSLNMSGEESKNVVQPIREKDVIDVKVDFDKQTVYFWNNCNFVGSIKSSKNPIKAGEIYPIANLSANTKVVITVPSVELKTGNQWTWSTFPERKSAALELSENQLAVSRPTSSGSNPAVLGNNPLTKDNKHFRVKVNKMGNWIGIGVADANFKIDGGSVLGAQEGVNASYFHQSSTTIRMRGQSAINADPIEAGSVIDVMMDFGEHRLYFWRNDVLQGFLTSNDFKEGEIFPCVNLSLNTEVILQNDDMPSLNTTITSELKKKLSDSSAALSTTIKWWQSLSSAGLTFANNLNVYRLTLEMMPNPIAFAENPFNKDTGLHCFRIRLKKLGRFGGVGLAVPDQMEGIFGSLRVPFACGWFWQTSGFSKIILELNARNTAEVTLDILPEINDFIDVKIDFEGRRVFFWKNRKPVGSIEIPSEHAGRLNDLFADTSLYSTIHPCAILSGGCEFELENEDKLTEYTDTKQMDVWLQLAAPEIVEDIQKPVTPFPTEWQWSDVMKADSIEVDRDLVKSSSKQLKNSGVFTKTPFTTHSWYFQVKLVKVGKYGSFGLADTQFILAGSKPLGQQVASVNAGFSWNEISGKISMHNEESKEAKRPNDGDTLGIVVKFHEQKIYFYLNNILAGVIYCVRNVLKEGKIFPAVCLGEDTQILIENQVVEPTLPGMETKSKQTQHDVIIEYMLGETVRTTNAKWPITWTIDECLQSFCQSKEMLEFGKKEILLSTYAFWQPPQEARFTLVQQNKDNKGKWFKGNRSFGSYTLTGPIQFKQRYKVLQIKLEDGTTYIVKIDLSTTASQVIQSLSKQLFVAVENDEYSLFFEPFKQFFQDDEVLAELLPDNALLRLEKKSVILEIEVPLESGARMRKLQLSFSYGTSVEQVKSVVLAQLNIRKDDPLRENSYKFYLKNEWGEGGSWLSFDLPLKHYKLSNGQKLELRSASRVVNIEFPANRIIERELLDNGFLVDESCPVGEIIQMICKQYNLEDPDTYGLGVRNSYGTEWLDPKLDLHQKGAIAVNDSGQLIMKKRIVTNVEMPTKKSGEVFHMAYTEAVDAVTSGRVLLPTSDFIHLAAIQLYIDFNDKTEYEALQCLPPDLRNKRRAKEVLHKYRHEIEEEVDNIAYNPEVGNDYEMDNLARTSSKRNLRSASVATTTSAGSEQRSQDPPNILYLKKQYIQLATSSRSFGFYYKVRIKGEFAKSRSSRSALLGINEDHIAFVSSRDRDNNLTPWAEFDLNKLRRWACGENTIFLDFGNHEPGLINLETHENVNIAGVLEAYINLMRARERAKQNQRSKDDKEYTMAAVSKINPTLVKFQSFNPDMPENDKTMILHEAVRLGKKEFVKLFIETFGAKVDGERTYDDKESSISETALHVAIEKNSEGSTFKEIARFLVVNAKADVNKARKCVYHKTTLTTSLGKGAPVKVTSTQVVFETPLHIALRKGDYIMAKWLINEAKADVRIQRIVQEGQVTTEEPCLYIATKLGNLRLVELLLGVNKDLARQPCIAKKLGVEVLYETCLHVACNASNKYESNQIVDELLKYNIDVEAIRRSRILEKDFIWVRETALHIATDKNNGEVVSKLLAKGANVRALRKYEKTSFFSKEETEKLQELAWSANDVAVSNNRSEESAIHIAVEKGYTDIVGLLLKHGADAWEPRRHLYNNTTITEQPLHIATRAGHTAIISQHLIQDRSQPIDSTRVHTGADGSWLTLETALHIAVENGLYEVTELLLQEGAQVDKIRITSTTDDDGVKTAHESTPLFIVLQNFKVISDNIENDRYSLKQLKEAEQKRDNMLAIAELLLEKGANLNIKLTGQDSLEDTPLLLIVHSSIREIIKNPQVQQELRVKWSPPEKKIEWKHKETYINLTQTFSNLRTTAKWRFWCETIAFIATLAILTAVILHNSTRNDVDTFLYNTALKEMIALDDFPYDATNNPFQKSITDIVNTDDAWLYIRGPLQSTVSALFVTEYARIIGNVTLRQVRVKKDSCKVPHGRSTLLDPTVGCVDAYDSKENDGQPFGTGYGFSDYTPISDEEFFSPLSNWYPQKGGFLVQLDPSDPTSIDTTLNYLQNNSWIDSQTRAVMAEMVVYNGNLNLFDIIRILIEFPPSGLVSPSWNFFPTTLYYDSTPTDRFFLFLELVLVIFFYGWIIIEIKEIRSEGKVWLTDPWNYIEVASYFLFNWLIILRIICFAKLADIDFNPSQNYIKGDILFLSFMQIQEQNYAAILGLLYWVKLFKYLRVWKQAGILLRVIISMVKDVSLFVIIYVVFAVAFGLAFHVTLGYDIRDMRSWEQSLLATFRMVSGDFDYAAMEETGRSFGLIIFYFNFIVSTILLLNLLIAMLNKSYGDIIERSTQEYLLERAKLILGYENAKKRAQDASTGAQKDSEAADIELVVMPAPASLDEVAKKVFDAHTAKNNGKLYRSQMEPFFIDFLVEFADHQNLPLIKTQIPEYCQEAMDFFFSEPDQTHIEFHALYNWLPVLEQKIDAFKKQEDINEDVVDFDSFKNDE